MRYQEYTDDVKEYIYNKHMKDYTSFVKIASHLNATYGTDSYIPQEVYRCYMNLRNRRGRKYKQDTYKHLVLQIYADVGSKTKTVEILKEYYDISLCCITVRNIVVNNIANVSSIHRKYISIIKRMLVNGECSIEAIESINGKEYKISSSVAESLVEQAVNELVAAFIRNLDINNGMFTGKYIKILDKLKANLIEA